jgi:ABC-2 type transport system permease protein
VRGLWNLTWLETKIFVREPLGLFGTVLVPVLVFIAGGQLLGSRLESSDRFQGFVGTDLPVFVVMLTALSAVLSLVTIIAIYREGGILKRLRATPLRPYTILTAHVLVKLLFTALTLLLLAAAGRRFYPVALDVPWISFAIALLISTISILSVGFLVASLVPTARFAQPIGTIILYPMLGVSGLFVPLDAMPAAVQGVARL